MDVSNPSRIYTLDVIRGVAVMGILAMNIIGFALPEQATLSPRSIGLESDADHFAWLIDFLFIDGRMRGLFSFLFGASMLLIIQRADANGEPSARIHFARMAWLLVFGLIHFYLIWWGDILAHYALMGMIAWFFVYQPPATWVKVGLLLVFAQTAVEVQGLFTGSELAKTAEASQIADSLNLYRSGFVDIAAHRLKHQLLFPLLTIVLLGWETLAYMLFGMAALRYGFLTSEWSRQAYVRIVLVGLGLGLPIYALLAWAQVRGDFSPYAVQAWNFAATTPVRPIMFVAYAALIILLCRKHGPISRWVAAAGRAAFTNYLGTSLVMTVLFYGWGLGWFGTLNRAALWLVVLAMWVLMLAWSKPWLDHFRYGPFEWLWRSLSRGEWQPMRKSAVT